MTEPGLLLGLDLTEVDRVAAVLERHGERFLDRVFRPGEIRTARRHPRAFAEHVAGRFAAKEINPPPACPDRPATDRPAAAQVRALRPCRPPGPESVGDPPEKKLPHGRCPT